MIAYVVVVPEAIILCLLLWCVTDNRPALEALIERLKWSIRC